MKIITASEMRKMESAAFAAGASSKKFMEAAGNGVADVVSNFLDKFKLQKVILLCGKGNNAGDAYVAGKALLDQGFLVESLQAFPLKKCSPLCHKNAKRFKKAGGKINFLETTNNLVFSDDTILLDGLLGTGFEGVVSGLLKKLISKANKSQCPIIAIDIPSGLSGDNGKVGGCAIKASLTIALGLPKIGCFFRNGWRHVGKLKLIDFGLDEKFVKRVKSNFHLITKENIASFLPKIINDRHKYEAGYVVGLAGSPSMPGAAMLSSKAALRGGAGIVRLLHTKDMQIDNNFPELIRQTYLAKDHVDVIAAMNSAAATFMGPGIGQETQTRNLLLKILSELKKPSVLDADALNIIAEEDEFILPPDVIMTPHLGEMHRLFKLKSSKSIDDVFLMRCQEYCEEKGATLVLKGGPTFVFSPGLPIYICTNGSPGMATAGSGDVLTGLLAALLAQGLSTHKAALLGTYLHGLAGSFAAKQKTPYSMIASDIIENLPAAFKKIKEF